MISSRRLRRKSKKKGIRGFLDTKERVRKVREGLEIKTENFIRDN